MDNNESQWQDKCWGRTRTLECNTNLLVSELELIPNTYCSVHYHYDRANIFKVSEGLVRVVWAFAWEIHHIDLGPGDMCPISSLVPHQFQVIREGKMTEKYWPDRGGFVREDDIVRLCVGGKVKELSPQDQPRFFGKKD